MVYSLDTTRTPSYLALSRAATACADHALATQSAATQCEVEKFVSGKDAVQKGQRLFKKVVVAPDTGLWAARQILRATEGRLDALVPNFRETRLFVRSSLSQRFFAQLFTDACEAFLHDPEVDIAKYFSSIGANLSKEMLESVIKKFSIVVSVLDMSTLTAMHICKELTPAQLQAIVQAIAGTCGEAADLERLFLQCLPSVAHQLGRNLLEIALEVAGNKQIHGAQHMAHLHFANYFLALLGDKSAIQSATLKDDLLMACIAATYIDSGWICLME